LQDDPPQNAPAPSATDVVFLRNIKSATNALTESFGPDGGSSRIEKVAETIAETVVERSVNPSRVNISVPLRVVDCLHQVAAQINQVS
jgi:phage tail sheath gpL-like